MGNGIGATVFGSPQAEKIYLNDATLWTGEPVVADMQPDAWKNIVAIREASGTKNYALAEQLNRKVQGSFRNLMRLWVRFWSILIIEEIIQATGVNLICEMRFRK